ncbi:MAG: signal peptidase I [Planctomycetota bacterium]|nr:signal peptidase I [Planctomycetota bacterium]
MKQPWFAVLISYFCPGLGHLYAGRPLRGGVFFLIFAGFGVSGLRAVFAPGGDARNGFILLAIAAVVYVAALVDAHRASRKDAEAPTGGRNPWLAGFLSYIIPGVGQLYGRQFLVAALLIGAGIGVSLASGAFRLLATPVLDAMLVPPILHGLRIAGLWHAQWSLAEPRQLFSRRFLSLIPLIAAEATVMSAVFFWVFQSVVMWMPIATPAMEPRLLRGDMVLVDGRSYLKEAPQRHDVVIYRESEMGGLLIARVVALPGEEVQVSGGKLQVKGIPVGQLRKTIPDGEWGSMNLTDNMYLLIADSAQLNPESGLPSPVRKGAILGRVYKRVLPLARRSRIGGPPVVH